MLSKARAAKLIKLLLPGAVLIILALSILFGLTLAQADNDGVARVVIDPPVTSGDNPKAMTIGTTADFTVRVLTGGELVNGVTLSIRFDTTYLKVVYQAPLEPGTQIKSHPDNPLDFGDPIENTVDDVTGNIRFTVGGDPGASEDFNVAIITFMATSTPTDLGTTTEVEFLVDGQDQTVVSKGVGFPILQNTEDFTGAWVEVDTRLAEIVIDDPDTSPENPAVMPAGSTRDFIVRVLPHHLDVNTVGLSIKFDPVHLRVVDPNTNQPNDQIELHAESPLTFRLINSADNTAGTIRFTYSILNSTVRDPFNFAIITFQAKDVLTGPSPPASAGPPTEVEFVVNEVVPDSETFISDTTGRSFLKNTDDFTGAWVDVVEIPVTVARFTTTPDPADEASPVTFDATASTSALGGLTYDWDFGDNTTGNQVKVDHTYVDDGVYNVSLTVTDDDGAGASDTISRDITVNNVPPSINNVIANPQTIDEGQSSNISVDASDPANAPPASPDTNVPNLPPDSSDTNLPPLLPNDPLLYSFDCNDDNVFEIGPQPGNSTDCDFPDASVHTVNVKVQDDDLGVSTDFVDVTVNEVPPTLTISGAPSVNEGEIYTLNLESDDPGDDTIISWTVIWDDGSPPQVVPGDPASVNHTYANGDDNPTITATAVDEDGGPYNSNPLPVDVKNLAPNIISVDAVPSELPEVGGDSAITVTAIDVAADLPLQYFFDCDGNNVFEIGPQLANSTVCNFSANDVGNNTVNVEVQDQDGASSLGSANVKVQSDVDVDDWTGVLNIIGQLQDSSLLTGNPILTFGVRPNCTDDFEFTCDTGQDLIVLPEHVKAYFDYPNNQGDGFGAVDPLKLLTSIIPPPDPERETLRFPLRVDLNNLAQAGNIVNITVRWDIGAATVIPEEFIAVLIIDHSPLNPLPAFNVSNMGFAPVGEYTFGTALDGQGKATRDLTIVVSRAQIQTMRLSTGPQLMSLSVRPIFGSTVDDIFGPPIPFSPLSKFAGPDRLSMTDEPFLFVPSVTTWHHDFGKDFPQRLRAVVRVGDPRHPELIPGFGYIVSLAPLDGQDRDAMLLIPGDPIQDNTRNGP